MKHLYLATESAVLETVTEFINMVLKDRAELIQIISKNKEVTEYKLLDKDPKVFWKVITNNNQVNKVYQIADEESSKCDFNKLDDNACNFVTYLGQILYKTGE